MNMTQANEALANYQHYALTQYTLNLHDIAEHGAYLSLIHISEPTRPY